MRDDFTTIGIKKSTHKQLKLFIINNDFGNADNALRALMDSFRRNKVVS